MTLLQSHNLPTTTCFVLRLLPSRRHGIAQSDLEKLLAPFSLEGPAPRDRRGAGGFATDHTISALQSTGLLDGDKFALYVAEAWCDAIEFAKSDREILQIVRRAIFTSPRIEIELGVDRWEWVGQIWGQRFRKSCVLVSRPRSSWTAPCVWPEGIGC